MTEARPVRIVECDESNGYLLPFARKLLNQLWDEKARSPYSTPKRVSAGPNGEQIQVSIVAGIGRISITGGGVSVPRFYTGGQFSQQNLFGSSAYPPRIFSLKDAPADPSTVADKDRITAVGLSALGYSLGFSLDPAINWIQAPPIYGVENGYFSSAAKVLSILELLVKENHDFASHWFRTIISRTTFKRNGAVFTVDSVLSLRSRYDAQSGDFMLLLGATTNNNDRPAGGEYLFSTAKEFVGVKLLYSLFKKFFLAADVTGTPGAAGYRFVVDIVDTLNGEAVAVLDVNKDSNPYFPVLTGGFESGTPFNWDGESIALYNVGPFANVYKVAFERDVSGDLAPTYLQKNWEYVAYELQLSGEISVTNVSVPRATTIYTTDSSTTTSSGWSGQIMHFDGEAFIEVGTRTNGGASFGVFTGTPPMQVDAATCYPITPQGSNIDSIGPAPAGATTYVKELDLFITMVAPSLGIDSTAVHPSQRDNTLSMLFGSGDTFFTFVFNNALNGVNGGDHWREVAVGGPGNPGFYETDCFIDVTGSAQGQWPGGITQQIIRWYRRNAPVGVCAFTNTDSSGSRQKDCTKYRNIITGALPETDPTWEPLDVILARIMDKTEVIVNNFASPALMAWFDEGSGGLII
jgi:hypothetical protein